MHSKIYKIDWKSTKIRQQRNGLIKNVINSKEGKREDKSKDATVDHIQSTK